ncbi:citrate lyase holo-[acyl-carrier protein] synthase [Pediococcus acidilactici]|uniref:citrate lyase holo-[acyl-carrier protein] synthase n=1 Tax=Pediococcus acidilactici TaxID=1254 RepID=UPI001D0198D4|nr:citrate lyase holo-[acyl-carrier protein] synthase [Pediococcus acidilactici]MCB5722068.1 citrate lyase holo-[acyl-carrier protein] synthase [Pediococcus acidilactici]MCB5728688.1 citrate lyase holo-[acyl-carrier protein] synthase [Pediococcus acidilactici]MCB5730521.1 citrate lyase holo-[acyl-carrier protein] synthase [Pediococcus acidilactici]MCB5763434.1 citrate lyase holo-[acyl-carrier protein] synthase [Pediococcus acidilactici]MCB5772464.1 citrate lyase holo-[acyl-carrier protein] syn
MELFNKGEVQSIEDILNDRDERVYVQNQLSRKYVVNSIVVIKLNIPGPIKNNSNLHKVFVNGVNRFLNRVDNTKIILNWDKPAGNTCFIISELSANDVKERAIDFENNDDIGRFFDIDVIAGGRNKSISRTDLGLEPRKCFVCGNLAKNCARSRKHSVNELQQFIQEKVTNFEENYGGK